ncbi:hypothetical protein [Yoonia algicola]|uniref:Uncharacterized protein n=1 Tax=Yoonia algicola TaxID=3137368 RepID=A0AAN0NI60_9RHOB
MTFTMVGRFIAKTAIVLAALRIATALLVIFSDDPIVAASSLLGSQTTGEAIDQAVYVVIFAICLGVLTDISRAVQRD